MARPRVRAPRRQRCPRPSRADRWAACAAGGTGPRQSPLRTVPFRSGLPRRGQANRPVPGAVRPDPAARRQPTTALGSATRQQWRCSRTPAGRRVPGRSAASAPTSLVPDRRSRSMIRPASGPAPGRSRPSKRARAGSPRTSPRLAGLRLAGPRLAGLRPTGPRPTGPRPTGPGPTGPPRRRTLTIGAGNGVRPMRPGRSRRPTGTRAQREPAGDGRLSGPPGPPVPPRLRQPSPRGLAAGPASAGPAG